MGKEDDMRNGEVYDENSIKALKGLEAVRVRPGMYIGSTDTRGLHHLVYEVVDNSIDEVMAGFATKIDVTVNPDGSVSVADDGRGIPTGIVPEEGKSGLEVCLTDLHAGGKFDQNAYKVSGGLHGVGVSVVNALSTWMVAIVKRDGKVHRQSYKTGIPDGPVEVIGETDETGTTITFLPDPTMFETVDFDFDTLQNRFRNQAFLNTKVTINFEDKRSEKRDTYHYDGGVSEFVKFLNRTKTPIHDSPICINGEYHEKDAEGRDRVVIVDIAMQYTDGYNESVDSFVNTVSTPDGGTHMTGFRTSLTKSLNDYGKENNLLKDITLEGSDAREGLTAIISIKMADPQFESQTKEKLGSSIAQTAVTSIMGEKFKEYLDEHPQVAQTILKKAQSAYEGRMAAKKARDATRRKSLLESTSLPGKLADCSEKDPSKCEIFIVEGESAGGSAKMGRDRAFQAILPIRGKILNVEKTRQDKLLDHDEIRNLTIAIGGGIGRDFDISKIRYHKVVIMTDADVDGSHICTLMLTFFFRYMRPLIDHGYVYVAQPPLFKLQKGQTVKYAYNDDEMKLLSAEMPGAKVNRYKGLGEMNPDQLWETTMNPDNRVIVQIKIEDAERADEAFSILMGEQVEPRRQFIEKNAKYANLDV
ncbi:DNA topoisomerase (ATP-hydrolyzing) subunit B [Methanomethylophilus alvi]|uniref:DNA topoisomerase (ATP-hydrolyzing) subunit B n=1 Tax=Methanomethylophilus alvi TaxID=1291540 RepID=UPI0037DD42E0